jgi:hypothetical protein
MSHVGGHCCSSRPWSIGNTVRHKLAAGLKMHTQYCTRCCTASRSHALAAPTCAWRQRSAACWLTSCTQSRATTINALQQRRAEEYSAEHPLPQFGPRTHCVFTVGGIGAVVQRRLCKQHVIAITVQSLRMTAGSCSPASDEMLQNCSCITHTDDRLQH